jgi:hypothetical protein
MFNDFVTKSSSMNAGGGVGSGDHANLAAKPMDMREFATLLTQVGGMQFTYTKGG